MVQGVLYIKAVGRHDSRPLVFGCLPGCSCGRWKATAKISIIYAAALFLTTRLQLAASMVHF